MSDDQTLRIYGAKAQDYAELTSKGAGRDRMLTRFIADLPGGGHVLDLGCGPGEAARVMAAAGLQVTAFDAVPEMVAMAARHPGVTAKLATFDDLGGTDIYDGVWANFSLLHAARADIPRYLDAIHKALRPDGTFHIALKIGTGTHRDRLGRLYTYYRIEELMRLLGRSGFRIIDSANGCEKGLDGTPADWVALRANG